MSKNSLTNKAYNEIKGMIITNQLDPGAIVNEVDFQRILGIGRTPVHEALLKLSFEQLVNIIPRKGIEISMISPQVVRDIFVARLVIEPIVLAQTSHYLDREWLADMREKFAFVDRERTLSNRESIVEYNTWDTEFHAKLVSSLNNRYLTDMVSKYLNQLRMIGVTTTLRSKLVYKSNQDHIIVIDHILNGEYEEACKQLEDHLRRCFADVVENYISL